MKRLVIFAHYDKDGLIDDYVIDYLKELKKFAQDIFFISDCKIDQEEFLKLDGIVFHSICQKHGEYDFGSYKRGIFAAKSELQNYDQLILTNDSCYLLTTLTPVFEEMSSRNYVDFWGLIQSTQRLPLHLQSYFIVFNKSVFLSDDFLTFFSAVKKEKSKIDIIRNYEVGLTQTLLNCGFKKDSFFQEIFKTSPAHVLLSNLVPRGFPFVKVEMLRQNLSRVNPKELSKWRGFVDRDRALIIENHLKRFELHSSGIINFILDKKVTFQSLVTAAIKEKEELVKIELLSKAASFASGISGTFSSKDIEQELLIISQNHFIELASKPQKNSFLHVFSECYVTGGHTRVCERWIEFSPNNELHSVILLRQNREIPIPNLLREVVKDKGGKFLVQNNSYNSIEKALELRKIASEYDVIILHVHMDDVVPIIAFGTEEFKRPVIFFNHADHLFWIGVSISDQVVNLRTFAKKLDIKYRGTSKNFVLPLPIHEVSVPKNLDQIAKIKLGLGFAASAKIILTIAASWKFKPFGKYNFVEMAFELVSKNKDIVVLAIGPSKNEELWDLAFQKSGGRINAIGCVDNDEVEKYLSIADIAIDSFPISSFTSMLDVAKYGIPCLSIKTPLNEIDTFVEANIYCADQEDLVKKILHILKTKSRNNLLEILTKNHFKDSFKENLKNLYKETPRKHRVHDFFDDSMRTEITDMELLLASLSYTEIKIPKKTIIKKFKISCKKRIISIRNLPSRLRKSLQKRIFSLINYISQR